MTQKYLPTHCTFVVLTLLVAPGFLLAEDTPKPSPLGETVPLKSGKDVSEPAKKTEPLPDPTELSAEFRDALKPPAPPVVKVAAPPPPASPAIPEMVVKALVETDGQPASAMIEINGKAQHIITAGSTFSVRDSGAQYLTLVVKRVAADGVEIEIVELKKVVKIR
ncbi:MAG: hypothetical protein WCT04_15915 [Planctomycetota bacterium]